MSFDLSARTLYSMQQEIKDLIERKAAIIEGKFAGNNASEAEAIASDLEGVFSSSFDNQSLIQSITQSLFLSFVHSLIHS